MNTAVRTLSGMLLVVWLVYPVMEAHATPRIEIDFESDAVSGQELIHAQAEFRNHGRETWKTLAAIRGYPALHPWIRDTKLVRQSDENEQEFLIEFKFPWPVGRRWSRILVHREGNTKISWRQLDGSLKINRGSLSFALHGGRVCIDYQAAIGVGLPDAWTRHHRKKFVLEFLDAVYGQVTAKPSAKSLALANSSPSTTR